MEYEVLRVIWWVILGVLMIGIAVMDGFDLGAAMLVRFIGKTEEERHIVISTFEKVWDGNQVWLILGAGAIFAAWPPLYGMSFSGFYLAILLLLASLIGRPIALAYRNREPGRRWRGTWDLVLFISGLVPALVYGVAFGNALLGAPFTYSDTLRMTYTGEFYQLFTGFAVFCGVVSVCMILMNGCAYVALKTAQGPIRRRAQKVGGWSALLTAVLFIIGGFWSMAQNGYIIKSSPGFSGPSNPLLKTVSVIPHGMLHNFATYPVFWIAPIIGVVCALFVSFMLFKGKARGITWIAGGLSIAGIITTAGFALFPFLMPSATDPNVSLTIWDASSSSLTLLIMTICTVIFLPIIILYTSYVYRVFKGAVTTETVKNDNHGY